MPLSTYADADAPALKKPRTHILDFPQSIQDAAMSYNFTDSSHKPLQARVALGFAQDEGTTRLISRDHYGPLLVQKPLYPEGRRVCHAVIIHPPGGIVSGDQLEITAQLGESSNALITTPGAAKWYKSIGYTSHQKIKINLDKGASLEWMPQETIFYNHADVHIDTDVFLEADAKYVGCEIVCFGRTASGESFDKGQIRQRTRIKRNGKLIWLEQIRLSGESSAMTGGLALAGKTVCATLLLTGKSVPQALIDLAREEAHKIIRDTDQIGISQLKSIIVARYLGNSSEIARHVMLRVWGLFRPELLGREAIVPRMWNT